MVDTLTKHVAITGVSRPQQVRTIQDFLERYPYVAVIEVDVRPLLRYNPNTGSISVDWPIAPQIDAILQTFEDRTARRVYYELKFGASLRSYGSVQRVCSILKRQRRHHQISGVTWEIQPTIGEIIDVRIAAHWARQTVRLEEEDLTMAVAKPWQYLKLLRKWQDVGITDIIVPLREIESEADLAQVLLAIRLAIYGTKLGVRLEKSTFSTQRLVQARVKKMQLPRSVGFQMTYEDVRSITSSIQ